MEEFPAFEEKVDGVAIRLGSLGPAERSMCLLNPSKATELTGRKYCLRYRPLELNEKQRMDAKMSGEHLYPPLVAYDADFSQGFFATSANGEEAGFRYEQL